MNVTIPVMPMVIIAISILIILLIACLIQIRCAKPRAQEEPNKEPCLDFPKLYSSADKIRELEAEIVKLKGINREARREEYEEMNDKIQSAKTKVVSADPTRDEIAAMKAKYNEAITGILTRLKNLEKVM